MNTLHKSILIFLAMMLVTVLSVSAQDDHDVEAETMDAELQALLHDVRMETARYHDLEVAIEAGYGKFLECFRHGEGQGMGQHYVNGDLVGDDILDPLQPEAIVYETLGDGRMTMVAFEYIVFADVWDPADEGREPPTLFGQEFSLKTNIPDTPPLWALHVWLWSHNPAGMFADYNPVVVCPSDEPFIDFAHR